MGGGESFLGENLATQGNFFLGSTTPFIGYSLTDPLDTSSVVSSLRYCMEEWVVFLGVCFLVEPFLGAIGTC